MSLTENDAIDAGQAITEALKRLCLLNPTLGLTTDQEENLVEEIKSRTLKHANDLTDSKIAEVLRNTSFKEVATEVVSEWFSDNLDERITNCLNEEFCERAQSDIEEYDLMKRCDIDFQEEIEQ